VDSWEPQEREKLAFLNWEAAMLIEPAQSGFNSGSPERAAAVRVIKPLQFEDHTPQTAGMRRLAAISRDLAGSENIWAGVMLAEPGTVSAVHHHDAQETVVYVLSGVSKVRWGNQLEHEAELEAGDFLFIPPYLPHQEINPSPDRPTQWIVVRSGPEASVVPLVTGPNGQFIEDQAQESRQL
jgi:uncharacterized RmlC-like cupin family protein